MSNNQSDAQWIWNDTKQPNKPNQYVQFRRELTLDAVPAEAELKLSVDTNFAAWVNGHFVGSGQYSDFPERRTCSQIEIAKHLKRGKNVLAILAHHCGVDHFSYLPGDAGLWFEVVADGRRLAVSDSQTSARTAPGYLRERTTRITPQRGFTFHYDSAGDDDWMLEGSAGGWKSAAPAKHQGQPAPRPVKMLRHPAPRCGEVIAQGLLRRTDHPDHSVAQLMQEDFLSARRSWELFEKFEPVSTTAKLPVTLSRERLAGADGAYVVLDLGGEECGHVTLDAVCEGSAVIDIAVGEHLDDLRVRSHIGGRNFASRLVARTGEKQFTDYLNRNAGRYIQLHITQLTGRLQLRCVGLTPAEYPVAFSGEFKCADSVLNEIWQVARRTLHLCMHEHFEDCPMREQGLYANDTRNQMLCNYYAFGDYEYVRANLELLGLSTGDDGYQELCSPMKFAVTIPSFTMTWFLAMNDYLLFSGDAEFIRKWFAPMQRMVGQYVKSMRDGLLPCPQGKRYWHMYDWADGLDGTELGDCRNFGVVSDIRFDAPLNLYFILVLQSMASMGKAIGEQAAASTFKALANSVAQATQRAFWDAEAGLYKTYAGAGAILHHAELVQSLAMLAGVGDDVLHHKLRGLLMKSNNGMVTTTLSQSLYKFEALLLDPACGPFVRDKILEDWSKMLYAGATSFWETLRGGWDFHHAGSMCHGWSGIPVYFLSAYGLGVRPSSPGFSTPARKPVLQLVNATGIVPTPGGLLRVSDR